MKLHSYVGYARGTCANSGGLQRYVVVGKSPQRKASKMYLEVHSLLPMEWKAPHVHRGVQ